MTPLRWIAIWALRVVGFPLFVIGGIGMVLIILSDDLQEGRK